MNIGQLFRPAWRCCVPWAVLVAAADIAASGSDSALTAKERGDEVESFVGTHAGPPSLPLWGERGRRGMPRSGRATPLQNH